MIHPTAVISPQAQIDPTAEIGPWCYIEGHVTIGPRTRLARGVTVCGPAQIGADNLIGAQTVIGGEPEDPAYRGEPSSLRIGDRNRIFESVVISRGSGRGRRETVIGDDNFLMSFVHVAHDCLLGNHIRITAYTALGGHVVVEDHAAISGMVIIQQLLRIGGHSFISGTSPVVRNVLPYSIAFGTGCATYLHGANLIGMKRKGFSRSDIGTARKLIALWRGTDHTQAELIHTMQHDFPDSSIRNHLIAFADLSANGVVR